MKTPEASNTCHFSRFKKDYQVKTASSIDFCLCLVNWRAQKQTFSFKSHSRQLSIHCSSSHKLALQTACGSLYDGRQKWGDDRGQEKNRRHKENKKIPV